MFEFSRNRIFKQLQIINYVFLKASLYTQTHKKLYIKLAILSLILDTAPVLAYKGWCANLPDTIQLYLYLGSYGSDAELFVHTVKKTYLKTLIQKWTKRVKTAE